MAITRAKALLIVVGNPKVLQIDYYWREFIKYCQINGACRGDKFTLSDMSVNEMKRLLNNRLETKYQETENPLFINADEILETRVYQLPENESPQRQRRLPKLKTEKPEREVEIASPMFYNGTTEVGKK